MVHTWLVNPSRFGNDDSLNGSTLEFRGACMNAAATGGDDQTAANAASRGDGESGKNPGGGPGHDAPPVSQPMTGSDEESAGTETLTPDDMVATSGASSGPSTQAIVQPAGDGVVSEEPPRRRRGILLGTGAGAAAPAAVDDAKSLSWMATQAVKAVNAVKASQLEQAQAWKAETGTPDDELPRLTEGDDAAIERQEPAQSFPGGQPVSTEAVHGGEEYPGAPPDIEAGMPASGPLPVSRQLAETAVTEQSFTAQTVQPVEPSQEGATNPRIPAGAHRAAASLVPVRMALMLGVLAMFSYAGYRYWFAGDRAASEAPGSTSAIIETAGPAEEADLMTPPAISVVAVPQPSAGSTKPEAPAVEAGPAPTPEPATDAQPATATAPGEPAAEEVNLMTPPPISVVPEPATEHSSPPAVEAGMAPVPGSATGIQPATVGVAPQPAPAYPASATKPEAWYPTAVPGAPSPAVEADVAASQPTPSSLPPPAAEPESAASQQTPPSLPPPAAEPESAASQQTPPSLPPSAAEAKVPAKQAATPAPAARPRYPANGYGYYPPPTSWQPYYRPGYPQAPAR